MFLGGYDPSNFNTVELCSVPPPLPQPASGHTTSQASDGRERDNTTGDQDVTAHDGEDDIEERGQRGGDGGGILIGVAVGEVIILTDPAAAGSNSKGSNRGEQQQQQPYEQKLSARNGTVLAPLGEGHSVRASVSPSPRGRKTSIFGEMSAGQQRQRQTEAEEGELAIWYYVHQCPYGIFHLCIGFLSGAGWEQLYTPQSGTRKGWVMEHGVSKGP